MKTIVTFYVLASFAALANGITDSGARANSLGETDVKKPFRPLLIAKLREQICTPDSTKYSECKTCTCTSDGFAWACMVVGCRENNYLRIDKREIRENSDTESSSFVFDPYVSRGEKVCEPGALRSLDCNTCFCLNDGSGWGCTLMGCPPKPPRRENAT